MRPLLVFFLGACSGGSSDANHAGMVTTVDLATVAPYLQPLPDLSTPPDLSALPDLSAPPDLTPAPDLAQPQCQWGGAPGSCHATCGAGLTAESGCTGGLFCCIVTPNVADNPPFPTGYKLMTQAMVTTDMTNWAVLILHDPVTYPMFSTTTMTFGAQLVLARVEWHPPDFQNSIIHRGVTLYVPK